MNTTWILTPLAVIAVLYGLERFLRRRSDRAWAADLAGRARVREAREREVALLERLYAMQDAEDPR